MILAITLIVAFLILWFKKPKEETPSLPQYKCKHCNHISYLNTYYCPSCDKDNAGRTSYDNRIKFRNQIDPTDL